GPEEKRFSVMATVKGLLSSLFKKGGGEKQKAASPKDIFNQIVEGFRVGVMVAPKRDTDMIELKIRSYSSTEASFVANTWMESYRDLDISDSRGEVGEVRKFLEDQLNARQQELTTSEEALKNYMEKEKVAVLDTETEQLVQKLAAFETLYEEARTDFDANEKRLAHLKEQLSQSEKAVLESGISNSVIMELEKQVAVLIGDIAAFEQQIKDEGLTYYNTQIRSQEQRLKGIQAKIVEEKRKLVESGAAGIDPMTVTGTILTNIFEYETENKSLKSKTEALGKIVQQYQRDLDTLPEKSLRLARLQRAQTVNSNIFMMLSTKYQENRIAEAGQIGLVRIVDRAMPPKYPISPKKKMNLLLGIMVGLGLGIGLTFLREYMDTSLKSMEDVERLGFTVLGSIPFITPERTNRNKQDPNGEISLIESRLITHFAPKSPISEAYRTLRTNIQYTKVDRPIKTVLVTSPGPGEGKSTSVANLAIAFSQMGASTLLVDTDLRRPVLHGIFGQSRTAGLTNVLIGKAALEEAIKLTKIDNLSILTSGTLPPNPSEMLASQAMERLIQEASNRYDVLLFDSPPVIAVTDAAVLATKLDGVVLVVKSGQSGKDALDRSRVLLENVNAKIFGILLNGVNVNQMYGSYYYYYHYYYYGDGKHKKKKGHKALV
ncbi:MAG: polysaccharide biosynthesis tyrosine autokinase, partial [bacterium]